MRVRKSFLLLLFLVVLANLGAQPQGTAATPTYGYQIVKTYPHDSRVFTQGLIFLDGVLYESGGGCCGTGTSTLRRVQLDSGKVEKESFVPNQYFAEGLTNWGPDLLQLTWQHKLGFVYDRATFALKRTFSYAGEGWGLTQDGKRLILSDGSESLRFLDPQTLQESGRIAVRDRGKPVKDLNELEFVRGEVFANVWHTDRIARISPATGNVTGWIDLKGLREKADGISAEAVLNGIAYDAARDRLFVTGKNWSKLFEIKVGAKKP
jgi:glutamine cyclotransferase